VRLTGSEDAAHLALLHWLAAAGTASLPDTADLKALQRSVLHGTLHTPAEDLTVPDAALPSSRRSRRRSMKIPWRT
jgi:hypothetical protein